MSTWQQEGLKSECQAWTQAFRTWPCKEHKPYLDSPPVISTCDKVPRAVAPVFARGICAPTCVGKRSRNSSSSAVGVVHQTATGKLNEPRPANTQQNRQGEANKRACKSPQTCSCAHTQGSGFKSSPVRMPLLSTAAFSRSSESSWASPVGITKSPPSPPVCVFCKLMCV